MHGYEPFWKRGNVGNEPMRQLVTFTAAEDSLLTELWDAHQAVAMRGNASGEAFKTAYAGSGDYTKALAGALATLGGRHAPIMFTMQILRSPTSALDMATCADDGTKIGGWGNSLVKGRNDPDFMHVRAKIEKQNPTLVERIDAITGALHARGKHIYPNPSCWTAATAITVGLPAELSPYLFIAARLPVWSRAVMDTN